VQGWISLHRKIQDHPLFQEKRVFSKFEAWIDLILSANHKDNKFILGNEMIEVKRGSFLTSELKLMKRWGWSKTKVRSFLKLLEDDGMIVKKSDNKKTALTLCNYNDYQNLQTTEEPQKNHEETSKEPQKDTNNNVNNDLIKNIVEYLNEKSGKDFKCNNKANKEFINARLKDGYSFEDFKKVIDTKVKEWTGTDQEQYIRPNTLFRPSNFEAYLNQKPKGVVADKQKELVKKQMELRDQEHEMNWGVK
jgi:uncharacterized phage protein (TIGR02220 family)